MRWPFSTRQRGGAAEAAAPAKTEDRNYTDGIIQSILRAAGKQTQSPNATSGVNGAAAILSNAFGTAEISGPVNWMPPGPTIMRAVGRDLIERGESLIARQGESWARASSWEVAGDTADEMDWVYRAEFAAPKTSYTVMLPSRMVAHMRDITDPTQPWSGQAAIERAEAAGELAGRIERSAAAEATSPVGNLIPVPADGADTVIAGLRKDLEELDGGAAFVESLSGWDPDGAASGRQSEWQIKRIGPQFAAQTEPILQYSQAAVFVALGLGVQLIDASGDAGGQREAFRRSLHLFIAAYGRMVAEALTKVAGGTVEITFERLFASDIAAKSRAAGVLVKSAGLTTEQALEKVGL